MLLNTKDLQELLRVGRDTAYALMRSDSFPSIKLGGRYFVTRDALERWLKKYEYREVIV